MIRVGVTGGIGSGKSTVCRLLEARGVPVYYSDARAREIMNDGAAAGDMRGRIVALLGEGAYRDGRLDRAWVAARVFADRALLAALDAIVHPAVAADFETWARRQRETPYVVLESAVLVESGFDRLMDVVVAVSAPSDVRVARVLARGGACREDVERRMANQMTDTERERHAHLTLSNDGGMEELAARVALLDGRLRALAAGELAEDGVPATVRAGEPTDGARESNDLTDK